MPTKNNSETDSPLYTLVKVTGPDHPGITEALMKIIGTHQVTILDIGQSVTFGLLSLSFVLEFSKEKQDKKQTTLKDLLFEANILNLKCEFSDVHSPHQNGNGNQNKFILNCVAEIEISASFIQKVAKILAQNNINIFKIEKISPKTFSSLEISAIVPQDIQLKKVKGQLLDITTEHKVDIAFLKDNVFRRSKRLIVFDMDSTLIQTEVIDEMAKVHGVYDNVSKITEDAMNGLIDFDGSLKNRVSQLKGLTVKQMEGIFDKLPLTPGVEDFVSTIKSLGYKVAIISGGFSYFADGLKKKLNLDYAFANELEIINGVLTGNVEAPIINADQKALLLKVLAQQEKISLEQVVAIGDGANDLPMLAVAGLGIAFHAKDIVKKNAPHHLGHGPMTSILYFLGIPGPMSTLNQ